MPWSPCFLCRERAAWGRSRCCWKCLGEADLLVTSEGQPVRVSAEPAAGTLYPARYRNKAVKCGQETCKTCPHSFYVYRAWRVDGVAREKYLGPAKHQCDEYARPELRPPTSGFGTLRRRLARAERKR